MLVYLEHKGIGLYLERPDELDHDSLLEQLWWIEKNWAPRTAMEFEAAYYKSQKWLYQTKYGCEYPD